MTNKKVRRVVRHDGSPSLLTEVVIKGELAGAVVWSKDRTQSIFVEVGDFRYFGAFFNRLYTNLRRAKKA